LNGDFSSNLPPTPEGCHCKEKWAHHDGLIYALWSQQMIMNKEFDQDIAWLKQRSWVIIGATSLAGSAIGVLIGKAIFGG
jgi:hypothetical protein